MKKAAVYMRVSTQNQEKEETIQNQEMEIMQRIEKDGALLLPDCIYKDEGWSGSIAERPDLDRMRTDAAVSYTHLDVYKRQAYMTLMRIVLVICQKCLESYVALQQLT